MDKGRGQGQQGTRQRGSKTALHKTAREQDSTEARTPWECRECERVLLLAHDVEYSGLDPVHRHGQRLVLVHLVAAARQPLGQRRFSEPQGGRWQVTQPWEGRRELQDSRHRRVRGGGPK